jgi:hypothetical protein
MIFQEASWEYADGVGGFHWNPVLDGVKARKCGFLAQVDTLELWLEALPEAQKLKILPKSSSEKASINRLARNAGDVSM